MPDAVLERTAPDAQLVAAFSRRQRTALLIAQFFPPFNSVASQRALRMARALLEEFEKVVVLTLPTDPMPASFIDMHLAPAELANPRLEVVHVAPLLPGYGIVAKPRLAHRLIGAALTRTLCSTGADWIPPLAAALRAYARARIGVVVATGGPFLPFLPATRFARRIGAPCVLDYRDLWSRNPRGPYPRWSRWLVNRTLERWINVRCSIITTVSEGCRQSLLRDRPPVEVATLLNTPDETYVEWFRKTDPAQAGGEFDQTFLNIVLTGTVYRECTCRLLAAAMMRLPETLTRRIKLHYFGWSIDVVRPDFAAAGLADAVIDHGYVSKAAAAAAVKGADLLLSLVFDAKAGARSHEVLGSMTTKAFDYFLTGKPIVNIGPPEADLCVLAREMQYGEFHTFDSSEDAQLSEFLVAAVEDLPRFRARRAHASLPDFAACFKHIVRDVHA